MFSWSSYKVVLHIENCLFPLVHYSCNVVTLLQHCFGIYLSPRVD